MDNEERNEEWAASLAREDAREAIGLARDGGNDPIVWITGNSFMPALRDFGRAEEVWSAESGGFWDHMLGACPLWEVYAEVFEETLRSADVYLGCPEYDNALFVVDCQRWQFVDDLDSAETLEDEWERHGVHICPRHALPWYFERGKAVSIPVTCDPDCHTRMGINDTAR